MDETYEAFSWVLTVFMECMHGRKPHTVLTDGDPAMKLAVAQLFPESTHRLCAWHIGNNATKNVHNKAFNSALHDLMRNNCSEEEFHHKWVTMLETLNLTSNEWCHQLYDKRQSWGEPFLRGKFVGGMRTTQRCESINSYLKKFLTAQYPLREFVQQIDLGIQKLRHGELQNDYLSKHTSPQLPPPSDPLRPYYEQSARILTRAMYQKVSAEIGKKNAYLVTHHEDHDNYFPFKLSRFYHGDIRDQVHYYPIEKKLSCTCMLLETDGWPCRHIFFVMKFMNIRHIPSSLIKKRWCKDAKLEALLQHPQTSDNQRELFEMSKLCSLISDA